MTTAAKEPRDHVIFSVGMRPENKARLDEIAQGAGLPSRNALLQAVAAAITVEQAKAFYETAVAQGSIRRGSTPEQRKLKAQIKDLTPEQAEAVAQLLKTNGG